MAEEQVHRGFFCHAFSLSITWGRGTRKDQTTCSYHATMSRDWELQLFTTSIGRWTIPSTIPLEVLLQHLTTTLEKEGESCLLEDFPKEAALENCGIDPRWRKWLKGPLYSPTIADCTKCRRYYPIFVLFLIFSLSSC